jgi:hypothetical protein
MNRSAAWTKKRLRTAQPYWWTASRTTVAAAVMRACPIQKNFTAERRSLCGIRDIYSECRRGAAAT